MNILLKRAISGLVFIIVVIAAVLINEITSLLLMLAVFTLSFKEFTEMYRKSDRRLFMVLLIAGLLLIILFFLLFSQLLNPLWIPIVAVVIISFLILYLLFTPTTFKDLSLLSFGLIWIAASVIFFIASGFIKSDNGYDSQLPMILFVLIWVNDVSAYLLGSKLGRTPLAPSISPGKTWEGFVGGVVLTSLFGWMIFIFTGLYSVPFWIIIGTIISLTATAGDLFESKLKREAGAKDSGQMIPGHGGILDRFDSLLFSAPVFFGILLLWNQLS